MSKIKIVVSPSITPQMVNLIVDLDNAGFIRDGYLEYNENQEASVKEIFDRYDINL